MTENFDRFPNQSKPPAATMQDETAADDKISTHSNAKNFTSETNNDDITTREEINYLHKSVANLRSDVRTIFREELKAALNGGIQA
jgi:hypothetical protein